MKKYMIFLFIIFAVSKSCAQEDSEVVRSFIDDFKNNKTLNESMIIKYFKLESKFTRDSSVNYSIENQIILINETLKQNCFDLNVLKHDDNLEMIRAYKLNTKESDLVFYVVCNGQIVFPLLVVNGKIVSISAVSKTEKGPKQFILF